MRSKEVIFLDREQQELKELVRYRCSIIEERAREVNRLQKILEATLKCGVGRMRYRCVIISQNAGSTDLRTGICI